MKHLLSVILGTKYQIYSVTENELILMLESNFKLRQSGVTISVFLRTILDNGSLPEEIFSSFVQGVGIFSS